MNFDQNINNQYFKGYYKEIWRSIIPNGLTKAEIEYLVLAGNLNSNSRVLDLMCGYGRHAINLGIEGINVVAVDNLKEYIDEIKTTVQEKKLPVQAIEENVLQYQPEGLFDMVISMGNSICFFNKKETLHILKMISRHLKPQGKFIINSWTIAEIAFNGFTSKSWSTIGNLKYLSESKFELNPSRIETESTIIASDGQTEVKMAIDYIYSLSEIQDMLKQEGLNVLEVYSIPGRKKFDLGDSRAYIIAEKN